MKAMGIVLAGLLVCGGCGVLGTYEKPSAQLRGVSFGALTPAAATLLFEVELTNPYPLSVPLVGVDYELTTRDAALLSGTAELGTTMPAKSSRTVTLPVAFRYRDLIAAMATLRDVRPGTSVPYALSGGLTIDSPVIGVTRLPLKTAGTLDVPTLDEAIDWKTLLKDGRYREILNR